MSPARPRALLLLAALHLGACVGNATGGADGAHASCVDYASKGTAAASFSHDVLPIFQRSCNFRNCHGSDPTYSPAEGLDLGKGMLCADPLNSPCSADPMSSGDIAKVEERLVHAPSHRSALELVTPGDPGASWLMAKLDYESFNDCARVKSQCKPKGCGQPMPMNSPVLDQAERAAIAGWIKGGAKAD